MRARSKTNKVLDITLSEEKIYFPGEVIRGKKRKKEKKGHEEAVELEALTYEERDHPCKTQKFHESEPFDNQVFRCNLYFSKRQGSDSSVSRSQAHSN